MYKFLLLIFNLFLFISCQTTRNDYASQLLELDEAMERQPEYVLDSLDKINTAHLQKA